MVAPDGGEATPMAMAPMMAVTDGNWRKQEKTGAALFEMNPMTCQL